MSITPEEDDGGGPFTLVEDSSRARRRRGMPRIVPPPREVRVSEPPHETSSEDPQECIRTLKSLVVPDRLIRNGDWESPLSRPYSFWFLRRYEGVDYEDGLFRVGSFDTVEQFWKFYSHLKRPDELDGNIEFHLFERGIRPLWEDEQNVRGGKWVMTLRKGHASSFWEDLVLGIVGGSFDPDFVTGAVLSIRKNKDVLSLWTGDGTDLERRESTRLKFVELLRLPDDVIMEYSLHNEALSKLQTTGTGEIPAAP